LFELLQVSRWIEMVVKIDFHPVSPFILRIAYLYSTLVKKSTLRLSLV
jgi:hypothetical protein